MLGGGWLLCRLMLVWVVEHTTLPPEKKEFVQELVVD